MTINDLNIGTFFKVFDTTSKKVIFSAPCIPNEYGDIPPDVAALPVLQICAVDDTIYIYTEVK